MLKYPVSIYNCCMPVLNCTYHEYRETVKIDLEEQDYEILEELIAISRILEVEDSIRVYASVGKTDPIVIDAIDAKVGYKHTFGLTRLGMRFAVREGRIVMIEVRHEHNLLVPIALKFPYLEELQLFLKKGFSSAADKHFKFLKITIYSNEEINLSRFGSTEYLEINTKRYSSRVWKLSQFPPCKHLKVFNDTSFIVDVDGYEKFKAYEGNFIIEEVNPKLKSIISSTGTSFESEITVPFPNLGHIIYGDPNETCEIPPFLLQQPTVRHLKFNSIAEEHLGLLEDLKHLEELTIGHFPFEQFPRSLCGLENLKKLRIKGKIRTIPKDIRKMQSLRYLSLDSNQISDLPPEIGELSQLKFLDLSWNRLKELPPEFARQQNLEVLILMGNEFEEVPKVIGSLKQLKYLNMDEKLIFDFSQEPPVYIADWLEEMDGLNFPLSRYEIQKLKNAGIGTRVNYSDQIPYGDMLKEILG